MDIQSNSHYIRVSPRKLGLLVTGIKKMSPLQAVETLTYLNKSGAAPLRKAITSALSNAQNRNLGNPEALQFKHISILPGSAMKRFRPVSRGMAHSYKKRMSHIKIVLTTKEKIIEKEIQKPVIQEEKTKKIK